MGVFFGVAKISIFWGVLKFLILFFFLGGGERLMLGPSLRKKKKMRVPPPFNTPMIDWCNAQLQLHKII